MFPSRGLETQARRAPIPSSAPPRSAIYPGESGDIVVVLKPNWIGTDTSTTTHGSVHAYDQHVPVIVHGRAVQAGALLDAGLAGRPRARRSPSLIDLPMPGVDGTALTTASSEPEHASSG